MPEESQPAPEKSKGDRLWLGLCATTGVVVDVTLNKYSGSLPGWLVLGLWATVAALFVFWIWKVEKAGFKRRFLEHPVSYVLMFLILIPFAWQATGTMISKLRLQAPVAQQTLPVPQSPKTENATTARSSTESIVKRPTKDAGTKNPMPVDRSIQANGPVTGSVLSTGDNAKIEVHNGPPAPFILTDVEIAKMREVLSAVKGSKISLACIGDGCISMPTLIPAFSEWKVINSTSIGSYASVGSNGPNISNGVHVMSGGATQSEVDALRSALRPAGIHYEDAPWNSDIAHDPTSLCLVIRNPK